LDFFCLDVRTKLVPVGGGFNKRYLLYIDAVEDEYEFGYKSAIQGVFASDQIDILNDLALTRSSEVSKNLVLLFSWKARKIRIVDGTQGFPLINENLIY